MSAGLRWTMNAAAAAALLAAALLGLAWQADRSHRWESPAWSDQAFVRLKGASLPGGDGTRWVMAVNLSCHHCLAALESTHAAWRVRHWRPELAALLVDTPERAGSESLDALPTSQVWWDAHGIWRRRWGHRIYGEVMQFDRAGRHVRTVTAENILHWSRLPGANETTVPVDHDPEVGGTK